MAEEQDPPLQGFPNSPFDEMLRRFFDQQKSGRWASSFAAAA